MHSNHIKTLITFSLCLFLTISLCACRPYIDQDFIDLNTETQPSSTEPSEPPVTNPSPTDPTATTPEETKPSFKPGGLVLPDEPTQQTPEPTEPTETVTSPQDPDVTTPESTSPSTQPTSPTGGNIDGIKISAGLKSALNSFGKTTYGRVTALQPVEGTDGSHTIIHIKNNSNTAQQYTYMYYESKDDYERASEGVSKDACNDKLRLILRGEAEVLPVTNPETMGIVLFDGYLLWR